jgi:hypothetical protein
MKSMSGAKINGNNQNVISSAVPDLTTTINRPSDATKYTNATIVCAIPLKLA